MDIVHVLVSDSKLGKVTAILDWMLFDPQTFYQINFGTSQQWNPAGDVKLVFVFERDMGRKAQL